MVNLSDFVSYKENIRSELLRLNLDSPSCGYILHIDNVLTIKAICLIFNLYE